MKNFIILIGKTVFLKSFIDKNSAEMWARIKSNSNDALVQEYQEMVTFQKTSICLN